MIEIYVHSSWKGTASRRTEPPLILSNPANEAPDVCFSPTSPRWPMLSVKTLKLPGIPKSCYPSTKLNHLQWSCDQVLLLGQNHKSTWHPSRLHMPSYIQAFAQVVFLHIFCLLHPSHCHDSWNGLSWSLHRHTFPTLPRLNNACHPECLRHFTSDAILLGPYSNSIIYVFK